jgi:DUF1365 family protein
VTASAIYDATVRHHRTHPAHDIRHRARYAYLDLDELPAVVRSRPGWSTRPAPVWFRRRDYLDGTDRPLRDALGDLIADRVGIPPTGPVRVLTQLRTLGWLFNPLTTYYCLDRTGTELRTLVLEITNTPWHERHWYVLDADMVRGRGVPFGKEFHVSPFLPMDLTYRCSTSEPGDDLGLRLELTRRVDGRERRVFVAQLTGRREPIDAPLRLGTALRGALQTVGVSAGIYAHAARLRLAGATFHRHPGGTVEPSTVDERRSA